MSISDELHADLIAYLRGELDEDSAARVERHAARDPAVRGELDLLRGLLGMVAAGSEITPTADETEELTVTLDDALRGARIVQHPAWRRAYDSVVHRYRTSSRFRATTLGSIAVHAAAAAVIAWMALSPDGVGSPRLWFQPEVADAVPVLDDMPAAEETALVPAFEPADAEEGFAPPAVMGLSGGTADAAVRFPTRGIMVRVLLDRDQGAERLADRLDQLADDASRSMDRGLAWLGARRADDGRWGPVPAAGEPDVRDTVTAAVVLAHVQAGRSAAVGDDAALLTPAVAALERRLRDGPAANDPQPAYSQALALRALTLQWALDFRYLSQPARRSRLDLLASGAQDLLALQAPSGGFAARADATAPDASCTLFAAAALADLRTGGVVKPDDELARAAEFVAAARASAGDVALSASALALAPELGLRDGVDDDLDAVAAALARGSDAPDGLLHWTGVTALLRHDRDVAGAMAAILGRQGADGRFPAGGAAGGDELATALGVLSVSRAMLP